MTTYRIPYGHDERQLDISGNYYVDVIAPADYPAAPDALAVIRKSIQHPVGGFSLENFRDAKSAAIAINDKTRPVPHQYLLPPLLETLIGLGIAKENIKLIIATGTHLPMPVEELSQILPPDIIKNFSIISHNSDDSPNLVELGTTRHGTHVLVNRCFNESDLRVVVGNIEPHHFMGFSGGVKSAAIGLAARDTINQNHAMLTDPDARIAEYERNPMRQDVEEIGKLMGVHFALNAVLNGKKQIVQAFAGDPLAVMQEGIKLARQVCQTPVHTKYDLIIASPGGHPKDINLYQAQKALTHASLIARDGATVILAAACPEGSGSRSYEQFMDGISSHEAVFEKFTREGFHIGPHKAFQIAREAVRLRILLVSEMPNELTKRLLLFSTDDLQKAFSLATERSNDNLRIAILPRATNTIPDFQ
jgi:nickel-dependent lactate racemase